MVAAALVITLVINIPISTTINATTIMAIVKITSIVTCIMISPVIVIAIISTALAGCYSYLYDLLSVLSWLSRI